MVYPIRTSAVGGSRPERSEIKKYATPAPSRHPDFQSSLSAAGIANLIHASREGSAHSLNIIANLARKMLEIGGDFEIMAGHIRPMVEGERDPAKLTENMTEKGRKMMMEILAELANLETAQAQTE